MPLGRCGNVRASGTNSARMCSRPSTHDQFNELQFTPDGQQLIITSNLGGIYVHDTSSFLSPTFDASALASHAAHPTLATLDAPFSALPHLALPASQTLNVHSGAVFCLRTDRTNRYAVTGGADSIVALWDVNDWSSSLLYSGRTGSCRNVGFSGDSELIAVAGEDPEIDIVSVGLELAARSTRARRSADADDSTQFTDRHVHHDLHTKDPVQLRLRRPGLAPEQTRPRFRGGEIGQRTRVGHVGESNLQPYVPRRALCPSHVCVSIDTYSYIQSSSIRVHSSEGPVLWTKRWKQRDDGQTANADVAGPLSRSLKNAVRLQCACAAYR